MAIIPMNYYQTLVKEYEKECFVWIVERIARFCIM